MLCTCYCVGFVGADLKSLVREAGNIAVARILQEGGNGSGLPGGVHSNNKDKEGKSEGESNMNSASTPSTSMDVEVDNNNMALIPQPTTGSASPSLSIAFTDSSIRMLDFLTASKQVQPTATREGFATGESPNLILYVLKPIFLKKIARFLAFTNERKTNNSPSSLPPSLPLYLSSTSFSYHTLAFLKHNSTKRKLEGRGRPQRSP